MPTLAESLKPLVFGVRSIPGALGLRPHSVSIVIASTSGTYTGDGTRSEDETAIVEASNQPPKVRWLKDEELAVGQLSAGTIEVGPITPSNGTIGTLLATLSGADLTDGQVRLLRITGAQHPDGADYTITRVNADKALHYSIQGVPVGSQA
jgi:hypothetical protein